MSSPPPQHHSRSSHVESQRYDEGSQYSLDLDALDQGSESDDPRLPVVPRIERVYSDAIDGPSDFTVNMEKWMKHSLRPKPSAFSIDEAQEDNFLHVSERTPMKEHTQSTLRTEAISHYTPERTPPRASLGDYSVPTYGAWRSINQQPLSPVLSGQQTPPILDEEHQTYDTQDFAVDLDNPVLPISESGSKEENQLTDEKGDLESRLKELSDRCQTIERLNLILTKAVDTERLKREKDQIVHEQKLQEASSREKTLVAANESMTVRLESFQEELRVQKHRLYELEKKHASEQEDLRHLVELQLQQNSDEQEAPTQSHQHSPDTERSSDGTMPPNISISSGVTTALPIKSTNSHRTARLSQSGLRSSMSHHKSNSIGSNAPHMNPSPSAAQETTRFAKSTNEDGELLTNDPGSHHRVKDLTAALDIAKAQLQVLHSKLELSSQQNDKLKQQVVDQESINALFDTKISQEMRKRDRYWQARLSSLGQEREFMSRALMHAWGSQEVGPGNPQKYKYRYSSGRNADAPSAVGQVEAAGASM